MLTWKLDGLGVYLDTLHARQSDYMVVLQPGKVTPHYSSMCGVRLERRVRLHSTTVPRTGRTEMVSEMVFRTNSRHFSSIRRC